MLLLTMNQVFPPLQRPDWVLGEIANQPAQLPHAQPREAHPKSGDFNPMCVFSSVEEADHALLGLNGADYYVSHALWTQDK